MVCRNVRCLCFCPCSHVPKKLIRQRHYHSLSMENEFVAIGNDSPSYELSSDGPAPSSVGAGRVTATDVSLDESSGEGRRRKRPGLLSVSDAPVEKRTRTLEPSSAIGPGWFSVVWYYMCLILRVVQ